MNLHENIHRIKEMMGIISESEETEYAVIEITKPMARMEPKYYYQEVPYWHTKEDMIFVKKGSAGNKMISTKNIKVLKTFKGRHDPEMKEYLKKLRSGDKDTN
jgi:hypothetical protein